jgi:hypothetical protein
MLCRQIQGGGVAVLDDQLIDAGVELGDVCVGLIDPLQPESNHEPMVIVEPSGQRLRQLVDLGPHPTLGPDRPSLPDRFLG